MPFSLFHSRPSVLCIGSLSRDVFFTTEEYVEYDTPEDITSLRKAAFEIGGKFKSDDRYESIGGVAANVAVGLARLGVHSACYTNVGDDLLGKDILRELAHERVGTQFVSVLPNTKSDLSAIIVLRRSGDRIIFHNRDANEQLTIRPSHLEHIPWIFVSALNGDWKTNLTFILDQKQHNNSSFAYNPGQHNIKENPSLILRAISLSDILVLNRDEAIELLKETESPEALRDEPSLLRALRKVGAKKIGLTDGKRGAWATDGAAVWYCPIVTREAVIDVTGAGDAFGSGFIGSLLRGESIDRALATGIVNSGSVVGSYGTTPGLLSLTERDELLSRAHPQNLSREN